MECSFWLSPSNRRQPESNAHENIIISIRSHSVGPWTPMLHSRRHLQILRGHASQTVQDQHQRVIELVRSGSAGGIGLTDESPVDGKLSCGRFSLVVRKTNWVLSLIQLADVRGSELACACAGTIPEPGQSRGASNLLIHGDRQQCQRGTPQRATPGALPTPETLTPLTSWVRSTRR